MNYPTDSGEKGLGSKEINELLNNFKDHAIASDSQFDELVDQLKNGEVEESDIINLKANIAEMAQICLVIEEEAQIRGYIDEDINVRPNVIKDK